LASWAKRNQRHNQDPYNLDLPDPHPTQSVTTTDPYADPDPEPSQFSLKSVERSERIQKFSGYKFNFNHQKYFYNFEAFKLHWLKHLKKRKIDFLHPKSHWRFWYSSASVSQVTKNTKNMDCRDYPVRLDQLESYTNMDRPCTWSTASSCEGR
jgi:hypothetical protein